MTLASSHLARIKSVTLQGYIKTALKERWNKILNDKYMYGTRPNLTQATVIKHAWAKAPPGCICKFPCTLNSVSWVRGQDCKCGSELDVPELRKDRDCVCYWFDKDDLD
jgi:hypothetical protein